MLFFIETLFCFVLYGIVLYCTVLCCIFYTLVYFTLLCFTFFLLYFTLLYDWFTKECNNSNSRVQISCVIAQFESRLNRFLKQVDGNVVFMENGSNKLFRIEVLVLETKREKYFQILSYFPVSTSVFSKSW